MIRRWVARCFGVQLVGWVIVACSTGSGRGSETHFICAQDADCAARDAGVCLGGHCVLMDGGYEASIGSGGRGGDGEDANPSPRDAKPHGQDSGAVACTPMENTAGLVFPGGYAATYGCHPTRKVTDVGCAPARSELRSCDGASSERASDLPCGACRSGDRCYMAVKPMCDCDGAGPEPPFVQDPGTGLVDGWICECRTGTWACYLLDQSGSSCFQVCSDAGSSRVDGG